MTSDHDDTDRLAIEITECKHMGISVLSPDVNESFVEFAVVPNENKIRFGMSAVKGVDVGAVEEVLRAREDGPFTSVEDFARRVSTSKFNRKAWESLIKSGAFDDMGDRSDLLFNLDSITSFASKLQKEAASGQTNLFGMLGGDDAASVQSTLHLQKAPVKHDDKERLMWERELLGLYISAHPLDRYETYLSEQTQPLTQLVPEYDSRMMTVGGIISTVRTIVTKSGSKMAFVGIEDKFGEGEIIVFPNLYEKVGAKLVQDAVIRVSGSAFRSIMLRFDPPKKVIYDNIEIAKEGDSDTLAQVTQTLASVGTNDVFNYLIDQADLLGASDIHIENQRESIRIRMRVDGALHTVAELSRDRYRVIMATLASRANISTASREPQSGHMQQEIHRDGASHVLNLRVEKKSTESRRNF
jgi:DNA polymerase III subunit alpha